jgi:hypothetical protein
MKKLSVIVALCLTLSALSGLTGANSVQPRHESLTTTYDPTRYSVFTVSGDVIEARGFYEGDMVQNFEVTETLFETKSMDFKPKPDGSYTAVFTGAPLGGYAHIKLTLKHGGKLETRVEYDGGWYFSDRMVDNIGLSEKHESIIKNFTTMPPEVTAQYLAGENASRQDIEAALNKIRVLAEEITAGIDDDYDKARAISGWVADNIHYDRVARDTEVTVETIQLDNVVELKRSTCSGYANLTAALYSAVGLKAITVLGVAISLSDYDTLLNESDRHHEWTAFWYEKENRWVSADSGWDSANYYDGNYEKKIAPRKYFDISPLALAQNHLIKKAEFRDYFALTDYDPVMDEQSAGASQSDDAKSKTGASKSSAVAKSAASEQTDSRLNYTAIYMAIILVLIVAGGICVFAISRKKK